MANKITPRGLEAKLAVVDDGANQGLIDELEANGVPRATILVADTYRGGADVVDDHDGLLVGAVIGVRQPAGQLNLPFAVHYPDPHHSYDREGLSRLHAGLAARGAPAYHVIYGWLGRAAAELYALGFLDPDSSGLVPESYLPVLARRFADAIHGASPGPTTRYFLRLVRDPNTRYERPFLCNHPERAAKVIHELLKDFEREALGAVYLDSRNRAMGHTIAYTGTLNKCIGEARGFFAPALLGNATALLLFHNHPSGCPSPSREDIRFTRDIVEAGKLLNIRVLDHVIVGEDGAYASLRERGLL